MKIVLRVTVLAAFALALFLPFSASATAQSPGLDQYTESIPGAGGNKTTDKGGGGNGSGNDESSSGPTLDSADIEALRSQGSDGERAADALEATSNTSKSDGNSNKSNGDGSNGDSSGNTPEGQTLDPSRAEGKAPVEAVFGSMFGGDGGIALPLIMLAVLVGGLAILVRRRHRLGADSIGD